MRRRGGTSRPLGSRNVGLKVSWVPTVLFWARSSSPRNNTRSRSKRGHRWLPFSLSNCCRLSEGRGTRGWAYCRRLRTRVKAYSIVSAKRARIPRPAVVLHDPSLSSGLFSSGSWTRICIRDTAKELFKLASHSNQCPRVDHRLAHAHYVAANDCLTAYGF